MPSQSLKIFRILLIQKVGLSSTRSSFHTFEAPEAKEVENVRIHDTISTWLAPLHGSLKTSFQPRRSTGKTHPCFTILMSYSCNIPVAKLLYAVNQRIAVGPPRVEGLTMMDTVWDLSCDSPLALLKMNLFRHSIRSKSTILLASNYSIFFAKPNQIMKMRSMLLRARHYLHSILFLNSISSKTKQVFHIWFSLQPGITAKFQSWNFIDIKERLSHTHLVTMLRYVVHLYSGLVTSS